MKNHDLIDFAQNSVVYVTPLLIVNTSPVNSICNHQINN